jgi:hypothetical protein
MDRNRSLRRERSFEVLEFPDHSLAEVRWNSKAEQADRSVRSDLRQGMDGTGKARECG